MSRTGRRGKCPSPWLLDRLRVKPVSAKILSAVSGLGARGFIIEKYHMKLARPVNASHQPELDIARLTRTGDQGDTRGQALGGRFKKREKVKQVWNELAPLCHRNMNGRQKAHGTRLIRC